jgi:hypothetical protein
MNAHSAGATEKEFLIPPFLPANSSQAVVEACSAREGTFLSQDQLLRRRPAGRAFTREVLAFLVPRELLSIFRPNVFLLLVFSFFLTSVRGREYHHFMLEGPDSELSG